MWLAWKVTIRQRALLLVLARAYTPGHFMRLRTAYKQAVLGSGVKPIVFRTMMLLHKNIVIYTLLSLLERGYVHGGCPDVQKRSL